jgi:hypothetical protein
VNDGNFETDLETFAVGSFHRPPCDNPSNPCYGSGNGEQNNCGQYFGPAGANFSCDHNTFDVAPSNFDFGGIPNPNSSQDLTQTFHQYGYWWKNDGTAHGTAYWYFDGVLQPTSYTYQNVIWDNGVYFDLYYSPGTAGTANNAPMQFHFVRAYQLQPN